MGGTRELDINRTDINRTSWRRRKWALCCAPAAASLVELTGALVYNIGPLDPIAVRVAVLMPWCVGALIWMGLSDEEKLGRQPIWGATAMTAIACTMMAIATSDLTLEWILPLGLLVSLTTGITGLVKKERPAWPCIASIVVIGLLLLLLALVVTLLFVASLMSM